MTKVECLELITNGENSGVEFKRDDLFATVESVLLFMIRASVVGGK